MRLVEEMYAYIAEQALGSTALRRIWAWQSI